MLQSRVGVSIMMLRGRVEVSVVMLQSSARVSGLRIRSRPGVYGRPLAAWASRAITVASHGVEFLIGFGLALEMLAMVAEVDYMWAIGTMRREAGLWVVDHVAEAHTHPSCRRVIV